MKITTNHVAIGLTVLLSYTTAIYLFAQTDKAVQANTEFNRNQVQINTILSKELQSTSENNTRVATALVYVEKQLKQLNDEVYKHE